MSPAAENGQPGSRARRRRAVLVGESVRPLVELLSDVLEDMDIAVHVHGGAEASDAGSPRVEARPDVVLVMVDRNDLAGLIARGRAVAAGAPVLAILPFHDERLVKQLLALGVSDFHSLDTPLERLKSGFFAQREVPR